jgi:hypothetical protein
LNARRLVWFAALWWGGVLAVGAVALVLKLAIRETMLP